MNINDIYTQEGKGKTYGKANYNPLLNELIQNIDEGGQRPDFMQMIRMIESNNEREAKASTMWNDKEADVMFLSNMFAATMKEKGLVDNLLEKAFAGDGQAMQDLYYKVHHTGSKEDKYYDNTKARVEQFMPLEI